MYTPILVSQYGSAVLYSLVTQKGVVEVVRLQSVEFVCQHYLT